jgi:hypothetical protein
MNRILACFVLLFTSTAIASGALVESDWELTTSGDGNLVFDGGRLNFVAAHTPVPGASQYGGYAVREWKGAYLNLAEDWTISIRVHLGSNVEQLQASAGMGVEVTQVNWSHSYPQAPVAKISLSSSSYSSGRFAFPLYGLGVVAAVDTLLVQSYSASEEVLRSFIQLPGGPLERFHTLDVGYYFRNPYVEPEFLINRNEPLKVRLYGGNNSPTAGYSLGIGDAYIDSFRVDHVALVPEPTSAIGIASLAFCIYSRNARRHTFRAK